MYTKVGKGAGGTEKGRGSGKQGARSEGGMEERGEGKARRLHQVKGRGTAVNLSYSERIGFQFPGE